MATPYTRSLSVDFTSGINTPRLYNEVNTEAGFPSLISINITGDVVKFTFASALSVPQQTTLDGLIAAHDAGVEPQIELDCSGPLNTTTTIVASQTANRTVTLPDADDTLVLLDTAQTMTNKTIASASNTLDVDAGDVTSGTFADARIAASNVTQHEASINITNLSGAPAGTVVGLTDTQTLTNKTLTDNTTFFQDDGDNSKKLQFELSGITTATTRTLTVPDASTTIVGTDSTQTLTNKTLTTPVISSITNTGVLTLPTSTDTLVGRTTTDTLTNKTISSATNTVGANEIRTTGASVVVDASAPPTTGQVLEATSATTATWQTPSTNITTTEITVDADTSTTSATYVVITGMTTTPASGSYLVTFSSSGNVSNNSSVGLIAIHVGGTIDLNTERTFSRGNQNIDVHLHTQGIVTVNGAEAIDVRYNTSAGTFTVHERSLILVKLS